MFKKKETETKKRSFLSKKVIITSVAITLILCNIIGGTVAWLISKTDPVKNTFTYGDINITLTETDTGDGDGDSNTNTYEMVPGNTIKKDPKVTVLADSEESWLFVKLEKSTDPDFDKFMEYEMADGWKELEGVDGVYYRETTKEEEKVVYDVIKGNTVTVKGEEVTKEMLNSLTSFPTLTITAYAVQRDSDIEAIDSAKKAWELVEKE